MFTEYLCCGKSVFMKKFVHIERGKPPMMADVDDGIQGAGGRGMENGFSTHRGCP